MWKPKCIHSVPLVTTSLLYMYAQTLAAFMRYLLQILNFYIFQKFRYDQPFFLPPARSCFNSFSWKWDRTEVSASWKRKCTNMVKQGYLQYASYCSFYLYFKVVFCYLHKKWLHVFASLVMQTKFLWFLYIYSVSKVRNESNTVANLYAINTVTQKL